MLVNLLTIKTKFSLFLLSQMFMRERDGGRLSTRRRQQQHHHHRHRRQAREDLRHPLYLICKFSSIHFMSHTKV